LAREFSSTQKDIQFSQREFNLSPSQVESKLDKMGETFDDGQFMNDDNKTEMTDNFTKDLDLMTNVGTMNADREKDEYANMM
jgi:hypothetical protein